MPMQQFTTEVKNRLQLTTEVPSKINCRRIKEKKKKKPRHLSAEELINFIFQCGKACIKGFLVSP